MSGLRIMFLLLIVFFVVTGVALVRRTRQRRAAWESGLTARARVVRAWTTAQTVNNVVRRVQWHEYVYTAQDGRGVTFKESGGPASRAVGDEALVYYAPDEPERATASEPQPGKDMAGTVFGLIVLGAGVIVMLYEMATLPEI